MASESVPEGKRFLDVEIDVVGSDDSCPIRFVTLRDPTYAIRIGRGSKSGTSNLCPADNNAWFDSRVMSREHAVLKADPETEHVYIEDVGSMHGTYLDNQKLIPHQRRRIFDEQPIVFGNEVIRGPGAWSLSAPDACHGNCSLLRLVLYSLAD